MRRGEADGAGVPTPLPAGRGLHGNRSRDSSGRAAEDEEGGGEGGGNGGGGRGPRAVTAPGPPRSALRSLPRDGAACPCPAWRGGTATGIGTAIGTGGRHRDRHLPLPGGPGARRGPGGAGRGAAHPGRRRRALAESLAAWGPRGRPRCPVPVPGSRFLRPYREPAVESPSRPGPASGRSPPRGQRGSMFGAAPLRPPHGPARGCGERPRGQLLKRGRARGRRGLGRGGAAECPGGAPPSLPSLPPLRRPPPAAAAGARPPRGATGTGTGTGPCVCVGGGWVRAPDSVPARLWRG